MPEIEGELVPFRSDVIDLLEEKYLQFNAPGFIPNDPISIPHHFSKKQDIEIAALFAAILAWGLRKTIISKCHQLIEWMDYAPHDFIVHHESKDLRKLEEFRHRTFNATDLLYFIHFLRTHYSQHDSLEDAFLPGSLIEDNTIEHSLIHFHQYFCNSEFFPERTRKHIATPARHSTCKRLNIFLRWMVRKDHKGVDFGIWHRISPAQLVCPCDVHVVRVARALGLIQRPSTDWQTALELTYTLRLLDPQDPVKYDFALFGLGVEGFAREK